MEGRAQGIEEPVVDILSQWHGLPVTYAGGIRDWRDVDAIERVWRGRIDFTVGSALDIFGGAGLRYQDLVVRYA